jgi:DNA-binding transcriptional ArsR family regulator
MFKHLNMNERGRTMTARNVVAVELARLLGVLAHPHRIRIVEHLRDGEKDVNTLQTELGIAHSGVSQHLGLLRAHHVLEQRREGRHVYYRLANPALAQWLVDGLTFLEAEAGHAEELRTAVDEARTLWSDDEGEDR